MFDRKSMLGSAVVVFLSFLCVSAADAQNPQCYTLASLQGTYAVIGTYGANIGIALATRNFDGNGNLTGTFVVNGPKTGSTTGERTITTGTQKGTYTVNCDGTGIINRIVTTSDGTATSQIDDFIITGATVKGWYQFLATSLVDAVRTPSAIVPGGIFLTRAYTRLPDKAQQ